MVTPTQALLLIPLLPLAAGLLAHLFGRSRPGLSAGLGIGALLGSAALGAGLLPQVQSGNHAHAEMPWLSAARLDIPLALDAGVAQLLFVLTTALLAAGILVYALRERQGDSRAGSFHANLTLFAGSMLLLLCADTLLLIYAAWELMGVMSFVLIAHTGTREAHRAARQAFWTTRATDMGLLFAVLILMTVFRWSTLSGMDIGAQLNQVLGAGGDVVAGMHAANAWLNTALILVLLAVLGKSAQWPLSFWLADAMVAPAPVSALLHAATLVAAGPYLLFALSSLLLPNMLGSKSGALHIYLAPEGALLGLALAGAVTAVLAGLMAYHARDAKRVLAYSTVSQLGLCLCGMGLLAGEAAFHLLLAHAWCKAALFMAVGYLAAPRLGAQSSSSASSAETDGSRSWSSAPLEATAHSNASLADMAGTAQGFTLWILLLGSASLAGLPLLAGALGKEEILWAAWTRAGSAPAAGMTLAEAVPLAARLWPWVGVLLVFSTVLTAAYLTRLVGILGWGLGRGAAAQRAPSDSVADEQALPSSAPTGDGMSTAGWQAGLGIALFFALVGSIGWALLWPWYQRAFHAGDLAWKWMPHAESWRYAAASALLVLGGGSMAWMFTVGLLASRGTAGAQTQGSTAGKTTLDQATIWMFAAILCLVGGWLLFPAGATLHLYLPIILAVGLWLLRRLRVTEKHLASFFAHGMYLREFWHEFVAEAGIFLAVLFGRVEAGVIDTGAHKLSRGGRALAAAAAWVDQHVVDGLRWQVCELWWRIRRLHSRGLQTGDIQHYMFIILAGAVILCLVVIGPLSHIFAQVLSHL